MVDGAENRDPDTISYYRNPRMNPDTEPFSIAQLLRKKEGISILNELGITRGIQGRNKPALWQRIAQSMEKTSLSEKVIAKLKAGLEGRLISYPEMMGPYPKTGCQAARQP